MRFSASNLKLNLERHAYDLSSLHSIGLQKRHIPTTNKEPTWPLQVGVNVCALTTSWLLLQRLVERELERGSLGPVTLLRRGNRAMAFYGLRLLRELVSCVIKECSRKASAGPLPPTVLDPSTEWCSCQTHPCMCASRNHVHCLCVTEKIVKTYGDLQGDLHLIEIDRGQNGLGLSLAGNRDLNVMSVFVCGIHPDSPVAMDGRLRVGDEILEVGVILKCRVYFPKCGPEVSSLSLY